MLKLPGSLRPRSGLLLVCCLLLAACEKPPEEFSELSCRVAGDAIELSWSDDVGAEGYRVYRALGDGDAAPISDTRQTRFVDPVADLTEVPEYEVRAFDAEGREYAGTPSCVPGESSAGFAVNQDTPEPPQQLVCRGKNGKVDLLWEPSQGAATYRVYRSIDDGLPGVDQIAEVAETAYQDLPVANGTMHSYQLTAVSPGGVESSPTDFCDATPRSQGDDGPAPTAVGALRCRAKNDKVNVSWAPVDGAAFYRVERTTPTATTRAGQVLDPAFADFGLEIGVPVSYTVIAIAASGAEAEPCQACEVTPTELGDGNLAPFITTEPLTTGLELHLYYYDVAAEDPEGEEVTYSLETAPEGMAIVPETGFISWRPTEPQVGPHPVEVRATDPLGAYGVQAFSVDVAAYNRPPKITSIPVRYARVGDGYDYDADAFDKEGETLSWSFAEAAPLGMAIDPGSGEISWDAPLAAVGQVDVAVRVADPSGGFDTQTYPLDVVADPLVVEAPSGTVQILVGETFEVDARANYAGAGFRAVPLPANATLAGRRFAFTPDDGQEGTYDVGFEASFAGMRAASVLTVEVVRPNAGPTIDPVGPFEVAEGRELRFEITGADDDGDPLVFSAPGLAIDNAVFDEIDRVFRFRPNFDQAGSYEVVFDVSDGRDFAQTTAQIVVTESAPPLDALDLVLDPVQSPTFQNRQGISGSIVGEIAAGPGDAGLGPLVVGMDPAIGRQGVVLEVLLTGQDTAFEQGAAQPSFGAGIDVLEVEVLSPTSLKAIVEVLPDAELGARRVRVQQAGRSVPSVIGFNVRRGASAISGTILDSFTGQPLVGARVRVNGSDAEAVTDENGKFELVGAPSGPQTLVFHTQNYGIRRTELTVLENQRVAFEDPFELDALARPFNPGGSIPRAATVASVLDRGLGSVAGGLDLEQAKALVADTILALGTDEMGVRDEAGNQLNPLMTDDGLFTLSPVGLEVIARRWQEGHVYDLGTLLGNLDGFVGFALEFDYEGSLARLQQGVDEAWANPGDPRSALPILLFNQGTSLSPLPPILTSATPMNALQAYLLTTSFIARHAVQIDAAVDRLLESAGAEGAAAGQLFRGDGDALAGIGTPEEQERAHLHALAKAVLGLLVARPAHAQEAPEGEEILPNANNPPADSWTDFLWNSLPDAKGAAIAAAVALGITAIFFVIGGGAAALLTGAFLLAAGTAIATGLALGIMAKMYSTLVIPGTRNSVRPEAPIADSFAVSRLPGSEDKITIKFQRSTSDIAVENAREAGTTSVLPYVRGLSDLADLFGPGINPQFFEFEYHLWRFSRADDTNLQTGTLLSQISLPVRDSDTVRQFVIRADALPEGDSFFRISTIQMYDSFFTRSIGSQGQREVYPIELVYQDFGLRPPSGSTAVTKSALDFGASVPNGVIQAQILATEAEIATLQARYAALTDDLMVQDGVTRELQGMQRELRGARVALEQSIQELTFKLRRHTELMEVLDQHIRDSFARNLGPDATVAALDQPFGGVGERLRSIAGAEAYAQAEPHLKAAARNAYQLETGLRIERIQEANLKTLTRQSAELDDAFRAIAEQDNVVRSVVFDFSRDNHVDPRVPDTSPVVRTEFIATIIKKPGEPPRVIGVPGVSTPSELAELVDGYLDFANERLDASRRVNREITDAVDEALDRNTLISPEELQRYVDAKGRVDAESETIRKQIYESQRAQGEIADERSKVNQRRSGAQAKNAQLSEVAEPRKNAPKTKGRLTRQVLGTTAEVFGAAADVADASIQVRDGIKVIPSPLSPPYFVRKEGDEIQYDFFDGILRPISRLAPAPDSAEARVRLAMAERDWAIGDGSEESAAALAAVGTRFVADVVPAIHVGPPGFPVQRVQATGIGLAPKFETDWRPEYWRAFIRTAGDAENPKAGYLFRDHLMGPTDPEPTSAGFPSAVIALDSKGRVYLNNSSSNSRFGGRMFRFFGDPVTRELVGTINYYSSLLGVSRAAAPVAMDIGSYEDTTYGLVEDLFIANRDGNRRFNGSIAPNRVLRLPVHLIDNHPGFAAGQRDRIVGQPYADHEDFRFTGPSDLEVDRRNALEDGPSTLYLSDEEVLYALLPPETPGGGAIVKEVLRIDGRRWSGIAVDANGHMLFADWNAGEVFLLTADELERILAGGPITSNSDLDERGFLLKVGLNRPTDIELDAHEARYVVSTPDGFQPFNLSVVGRFGANVREVRLVVAGRELPVTRRPDRGNIFIAGFASERTLGKTAILKTRMIDPGSGREFWAKREIQLSLFGASPLEEPL